MIGPFASRRDRALLEALVPLLDHACIMVRCDAVLKTGDHDASCVRALVEYIRKVRLRHGGADA